MKDFEVYSSLKVPKNSKIIVRLDGRSFHKLARDLNLVKPYDENFYRVIFDGRIEKINSVIASFTASSFVLHYDEDFKKPPSFDSRIIPISDEDILKYFKWRQDESWKNCIASHGISFLKSKYSNKRANDMITGLKSSEIHELLYQNGINLNDVETYKKRGIAVYRKNKKVVGFNKKENREQGLYFKVIRK